VAILALYSISLQIYFCRDIMNSPTQTINKTATSTIQGGIAHFELVADLLIEVSFEVSDSRDAFSLARLALTNSRNASSDTKLTPIPSCHNPGFIRR